MEQPRSDSMEGAPISFRCVEPFEVKNASVAFADIL